MTSASKSPFPSPLQIGVVDHFCHPREGHLYSRAVWQGDAVLTANHFHAIRFTRGMWVAKEDFDAAPAEFLKRFEALPWGRFEGIPDEWRKLDEIRGELYRSAPISPWDKNGNCAPSRVWRVNGTFLARLSHLQLIARLPRCEVHLGVMAADAPLLFRFNGGMGMLVADRRLTEAGFSVFEPRRHHEDGERVAKPGPCVLPRKEPYWKSFET